MSAAWDPEGWKEGLQELQLFSGRRREARRFSVDRSRGSQVPVRSASLALGTGRNLAPWMAMAHYNFTGVRNTDSNVRICVVKPYGSVALLAEGVG